MVRVMQFARETLIIGTRLQHLDAKTFTRYSGHNTETSEYLPIIVFPVEGENNLESIIIVVVWILDKRGLFV